MALLRTGSFVLTIAGLLLAVSAAPFLPFENQNAADLEELTELLREQDLFDELYAEEKTNGNEFLAETGGQQEGVSNSDEEAGEEVIDATGQEIVDATDEETKIGQSGDKVMEEEEEEEVDTAEGKTDNAHAEGEASPSGQQATGAKSSNERAASEEIASLLSSLAAEANTDHRTGVRVGLYDFMRAKMQEYLEEQSQEHGLEGSSEEGDESKTITSLETVQSDAHKSPSLVEDVQEQTEGLIVDQETETKDLEEEEAKDDTEMTATGEDLTVDSGNLALSKSEGMHESSGKSLEAQDLDESKEKAQDAAPDMQSEETGRLTEETDSETGRLHGLKDFSSGAQETVANSKTSGEASEEVLGVEKVSNVLAPEEVNEDLLEGEETVADVPAFQDVSEEALEGKGEVANIPSSEEFEEEAWKEEEEAPRGPAVSEEANEEVSEGKARVPAPASEKSEKEEALEGEEKVDNVPAPEAVNEEVAEAEGNKAEMDSDSKSVEVNKEAEIKTEDAEPLNANSEVAQDDATETKTGQEETLEAEASGEEKKLEHAESHEEKTESVEETAKDMDTEEHESNQKEHQVVQTDSEVVQDDKESGQVEEQATDPQAMKETPGEAPAEQEPADFGSQLVGEETKQTNSELESDKVDEAETKAVSDHDTVVEIVHLLEKMSRVLDQSPTFLDFREGLKELKEVSDIKENGDAREENQLQQEVDKTPSLNQIVMENAKQQGLKTEQLSAAASELQPADQELTELTETAADLDKVAVNDEDETSRVGEAGAGDTVNALQETEEVSETQADSQDASLKTQDTQGAQNVEVESALADELKEIEEAGSAKEIASAGAAKPQLVAEQGSEEGSQDVENKETVADKTTDTTVNELGQDNDVASVKTAAGDATLLQSDVKDSNEPKPSTNLEEKADGEGTETEEDVIGEETDTEEAVAYPQSMEKVDLDGDNEGVDKETKEEILLLGNDEKEENLDQSLEQVSGVQMTTKNQEEVASLEKQLNAVSDADAEQSKQVDGLEEVDGERVGDAADSDLQDQLSGLGNEETKEGALQPAAEDENTEDLANTKAEQQANGKYEFAECNMKASSSDENNHVTGQLVFRQLSTGGVTDIWATLDGLRPGEVKEVSASMPADETSNECNHKPFIDLNSYSLLWNAMMGGQGDSQADTTGRFLVTWSTESLGLTGENSIIGRTIVVHGRSEDRGQMSPAETVLTCCTVTRAYDVTL